MTNPTTYYTSTPKKSSKQGKQTFVIYVVLTASIPQKSRKKLFWQVLEKPWKSLGKVSEKSWKSLGKVLEKDWKSLGKVLKKYWKSKTYYKWDKWLHTLIQNKTVLFKKSKIQSYRMSWITFVKDILKYTETLIFCQKSQNYTTFCLVK